MQGAYEGHGIRFLYPESWELREQTDDQFASISVESPHTSSWSISLFLDNPTPEEVVGSAVETFRDEYDEVDVYPSQETLPGRPGVSRDLDFFCFELINSAFLRAFRTERFTALVLYQGFDGELETTRPLLESISNSLEVLE